MQILECVCLRTNPARRIEDISGALGSSRELTGALGNSQELSGTLSSFQGTSQESLRETFQESS